MKNILILSFIFLFAGCQNEEPAVEEYTIEDATKAYCTSVYGYEFAEKSSAVDEIVEFLFLT